MVLLTQKILNRDLVMSPDLFAQIVEQLEDGEYLLGCPVIWEDEGDAALAARRQEPGLHDFALRRCRARCSERSRASLRR